jgi:hypothetical protein
MRSARFERTFSVPASRIGTEVEGEEESLPPHPIKSDDTIVDTIANLYHAIPVSFVLLENGQG